MGRLRTYTTERGIVVRSKFEAKILEDLDSRGVEYEYEAHTFNWHDKVRGQCEDCGSKDLYVERWYTPDVFLPNGLIVEIKGKFAPIDRRIQLGIRELHPELEIRLLFQRDNTLSKNSLTRYTEWCIKNGIVALVGDSIPEDWITQ